jgi:hypothetical protein
MSAALVLSILSLLGSALTAIKLYHTGLYRNYPIFFTYFIFRVFEGVIPLVLRDVRSPLYQKLWLIDEPIVCLFYVLVVMELSRRVLNLYPGLFAIFRMAMLASVVVSMAVSVASFAVKTDTTQRSNLMVYFLVGERGLDLAISIFILLLLFVLSRYPITLSRNVRVHAGVFAVYFISNTAAFLLRSVFGLKVNTEVNLALMTVTVAAIGAWLLLLNPKGEEIPVAKTSIRPEHEQRLLTQLDSLNQALLKASGS